MINTIRRQYKPHTTKTYYIRYARNLRNLFNLCVPYILSLYQRVYSYGKVRKVRKVTVSLYAEQEIYSFNVINNVGVKNGNRT